MFTNPPLVLRGATLIDGTGAPPLPDATVIIRDGRLEAVGPSSLLRCPEGADVRDLRGRWLIPGLIDAHAHVAPGADHKAWQALLTHGVTAIRNPAGTLPIPPPEGERPGRMLRAGPPIDRPPGTRPDAELVSTPEEMRTAVRHQAAAGVDFIKLYVHLTPELVHAGIHEAHGLGIKVLGDLATTCWADAARAGIDFLSHALPRHPALLPKSRRVAYLDDLRAGRVHPFRRWFELVDLDGPEITDAIRALVEHNVVVDPTLVSVQQLLLGSDHDRPPLDCWHTVLGLVARLHEAGVTILAGSDCPRLGVAPGESLHRELSLLVDAGLSPMGALRAATGQSARALGWDHRCGTLTPGRRADLVILGQNPLAQIRHTTAIEGVVLSGTERARA